MERLVNRSLLTTLATLLVAVVLVPDFARAADDDDVLERVVVRNRKYTTWQKFEVTPTIGFSLTNRLTNNVNFQLGLAYNLSENWAIEARPGFNTTSLSGIGETARDQIYARGGGEAQSATDDFPDMWGMQWQALLMPRWTPIYGKLNLVTELPIHFQAYLTAGGGAVGLARESITYCQNGGAQLGECAQYLEEEKTTWLAAAGGGMRFFVSEMFTLRFELLDYIHPDEHRTGILLNAARDEAVGSDPQQGTVESGLTHVLMFNIGASVLF